jgi:hypothetical protein
MVRQAHHEPSREWLVTQLSDGFYRSHVVRGNDWNSWQGSEASSSVGCIRDSNALIASKLRWFASAEPPYEIKDDSFELILTVRPELVGM